MTNPGRRARAKAEKRARILQAADQLFAEHGYAATTTQQIADEADVATGTVFSYAASKVELLMMVVNERLRSEVEHGISLARQDHGSCPDEPHRDTSTEAAIGALLRPVLELARHNRENFVVFAREVIFGQEGEHHDEAVETVERLTDAVGDILKDSGRLRPGVDAARTGRAVFSVVLLEIQRARRGRAAEAIEDIITEQIRTILHGAQLPEPERRRTTSAKQRPSSRRTTRRSSAQGVPA